jgi:hypothetical protein
VDVRFLPDRQKLGAMVREMQDDQKAYPIMELASLFIQKADHYLVKMEAREPREGEVAVRLYQFTPSQAVFTSRERLTQYALANHLDDHFEVEETEGPAPIGNFQCVCRCTMTGTLLGPPNYHGTQARIQQMVTTRFPRLGIEEYRTRIETIRDPELVEQWKQESRVQKRYRLKTAKPPAAQHADPPAAEPPVPEPDEPAELPDPAPVVESDAGTIAMESPPAPDLEDPTAEVPATAEYAPGAAPDEDASSDGAEASPAMTREEARQYFLDRILPKMVREAKRAVMPATVAQRLEDPALKWVIRDAWQRENRFPLSLSLAMRPAFRHMRLHLFKVNRKQVFVTAVAPRPLDADAAIAAIQRELEFLRAHPGCTRRQLVDGLCPGEPLDSPRIAEVVGNLRWLIDKGHVIEFYNGRLSLPSAKGAGPRHQTESTRAPGQAPADPAADPDTTPPEPEPAPGPTPADPAAAAETTPPEPEPAPAPGPIHADPVADAEPTPSELESDSLPPTQEQEPPPVTSGH